MNEPSARRAEDDLTLLKTELHTHTVYCDGKNTPEEMLLSAIEKGFLRYGFSGHSETFFDHSYCMTAEKTEAYKKEIARLKRTYGDRIEIYCGVEQDYYSTASTDGYDYVIGSVHYLKFGDDYVPVDEGNGNLLRAAENYCGGDILSVFEKYYETVSDVVRRTGCDIIGHFDLPTKYLEREPLFDLNEPRYVAAWQKAANVLLQTDAVFEMNSGAVSRGKRDTPYPADDILAYLSKNGGKVLFSGDAHSRDGIGFLFDRMDEKRRRHGLKLALPRFLRTDRYSI